MNIGVLASLFLSALLPGAEIISVYDRAEAGGEGRHRPELFLRDLHLWAPIKRGAEETILGLGGNGPCERLGAGTESAYNGYSG